MKKLVSLFLPLLLVLTFAGCATNDSLAFKYQYITLKQIEKGTFSAAEVIAGVEAVRAIGAEQSLSFDDYRARVYTALGYAALAPADQYLITMVLGDLQADFGLLGTSPLSPDLRRAIGQRLDWLQDAARMAGG